MQRFHIDLRLSRPWNTWDASSRGRLLRPHLSTPASREELPRGRESLSSPGPGAAGRASPKDLEGEHVFVVGLGVSGRAACELALSRGATVTAADSNLSNLHLKGWLGELGDDISVAPMDTGRLPVAEATLMVLSPGVSPSNIIVQEAVRAGVPVTSELAFAVEALPGRTADGGAAAPRMVAITGTNGKSSVTHFTAQLLEKAGVRAWAGGNLGVPASVLALGMHQGGTGALRDVQVAVLEVSSYMLEQTPGSAALCPDAAAVLNLTPDHLERHGDMESYAAAKCRVFRGMDPSSLALLPDNDALLHNKAEEANPSLRYVSIGGCRGVMVDPETRRASIVVPGREDISLDMGRLPPGLAGAHNAVNAAVAAALAAAVGGEEAVTETALQRGIEELQGLPHRMEVLGRCSRGLEWINDSKATNVESAAAGIGGLACEGRKGVVLLGGLAKRSPGSPRGLGFRDGLGALLQKHRAVVTFGRDGAEILRELSEDVPEVTLPFVHAGSLRGAVEEAMKLGEEGDVLLLSPGCASFDEFSSFEHRGKAFAEIFRECIVQPQTMDSQA